MSSQVAGRLQVNRSSRGLVALAAASLDPQRLANWIRAGRTGALEATRLLTAANEAHLERLRTLLQQRSFDALLVGVESAPADARPATSDPLAVDLHDRGLGHVLADSALTWQNAAASAEAHLVDAIGDPLLATQADDASVLAAAFAAALLADGFEVEEIDSTRDGLSVSGSRGEQQARIEIDTSRHVLIDVGRPGFASTAECEATREDLLAHLERFGIAISDPQRAPSLAVPERRLAAKVEHAVRQSLPGFQIRSILEGDELQIVALPPTEPEVGEQ